MAVTVQQEVAALYSAIFNRAPDQAGLEFWVNAIEGGDSLVQAAEGFTQHPVFAETYAGLTNIEFVQQLYINVLGSAGDAKGIQFWTDKLASGVSKGQVVAEFVQGSLSIDLDALLASGELSQAEYDAAVVRQDSLTNKANVGVYFAETFGAASNLSADTDTTTKAGLESDPAYLASQAAIANVTNSAASVTAAQGRIDVAVGTNDPVGNLIGANSELTAALVDLQAKQAAVADALEALALADNANEADGAPVLDAESTPTLETFVAGYNAAAAAATLTEAENLVATEQADLAAANLALSSARNTDADSNGKLDSDANLAAEVTAALNAVNADTAVGGAKELYAAVNNAEAALAADLAAKGDSVALLTALRTAIAEYTKAGGDLTATIDGSTATYTVANLLTDVNAALQADAAASAAAGSAVTANSDALLDTIEAAGYAGLEVVAPATELTVVEKAVNAAIDTVEAREVLVDNVAAREATFVLDTEGAALRTAELAVETREGLIEDVAEAQADLAAAQEYLAQVNSLYSSLESARANLEAAQDALGAAGYTLDVDKAGDLAGTVDELFVADLTLDPVGGDYQITDFAGDDQLFIGTQFQFGGATSATLTDAQLFAQGSSSALEVFFTVDGVSGNVLVNIETEAFASNGAVPANDLISIELAGVTSVDDVTFANGFVSLV